MISSAVNHIKTHRLKRRLGLKTWQVVGLLESLWLFTQLNAPDGAIGRLTNEDIAAWMEWDGDADELIEHMIGAGWIDRSDTHRLLVHDWAEHAPRWVKGNVVRNGNQFAKELPREAPKELPRELPYRAKELPRESPYEPPPSVAKPSLAKPSVCEERTHEASGQRETFLAGPSEAAKAFQAAYPRKSKPAATAKQFEATVIELVGSRGWTDIEAQQFLIDRAECFAGQPSGMPPPPGEENDFRPYGVNWLANGCYDEPVTEWQKPNCASRTNNGKPKTLNITAGQVAEGDGNRW